MSELRLELMSSTQPVKNLSGGGFTFEDRFGAWLAASMLADAPPLDPRLGAPVRIDFQVDADGWQLDDILITFPTGRCCGSVKSFAQVASGKASNDFVVRAWKDILGISGAGFDADVDLVAMVSAPLDLGARGDLHALIGFARAQDPEDLAARVPVDGYVSASRQTLFDSFERPTALVGQGNAAIGDSPGELLRRLRLLEADFEYSPSRGDEQALDWCRRAVRDDSQAAGLWDALLTIVSEYRPVGGRLDGSLLVSLVRDRFELRDHPAYEQDWDALRALSVANIEQISDRLGGELHVDRSDPRFEVNAAASESRLVALVGPSGCGKSALMRAWAAGSESQEVVVLRAEQVAALAQPGGGLSHPLPQVLLAARRPAWLAVDGLDRAFSPGADAAVASIATAVESEVDSALGVMVTCQQQEWAPLGDRLAARNAIIDWRVVPMTTFTDAELADVLSTYPKLRDIAYRGRLTGALQNPKVLDTILRASAAGSLSDDAPIRGEESMFAKWFYDRLVVGSGAHRAARGGLAMRIAEDQADRQRREVPVVELNPAGVEYLDELERDGVCVQTDGRVRFAHDLYGDWIRRCLILAHEADRAEYIRGKLTSPLWHRAIRLHALSLLETDGPELWRQQMTRLGGQDLGLLQDLFLEAILFAADPDPLLAAAWPVLVDADGALLRRMLVKFLDVGTVPNPRVLAAVARLSEELTTQVAATQRLPYWPLWLPLLRPLSEHADDALALAGDEVARVADLWLRWTSTDFPLREQAAGLAIARGRQVLEQISAGQLVYDDVAARAWRAVLACAHERPDDIDEIAVALAPPVTASLRDAPDELGVPRSRQVRVNQPFRETCLDSDALHPAIVAAPKLAAELLFLVLEPRPPTSGFGLPGDEIGFGRVSNWFTPLYTRGPFLAFLGTAPTQAVALVVRLIEAATDRWSETRQYEVGHLALTLDDGAVAEVRGGEEIMHWYRGDSRVGPPFASLLMALEKWLYDEADAGADISATVAGLLAQTTSTAMIGLLVAVACRHPGLLRGPLRPLLGVPELYLWDSRYKLHERQHLLMGLFQEQEEFQRLAEEWFLLEHRRLKLEDRVTAVHLTDADTAAYLSEQLSAWRARLDDAGEPAALRFLICRLDPANWMQQLDPDGKLRWVFEAPPDLAAESQSMSEKLGRRQFWMTFPCECRRILDGELDLPPDQLEAFWEWASSRVSEPAPEDVVADGVITADDARCGFAAVMVVRNREWLRQHPDRESLCIDLLLNAAAAERVRQWFDTPGGATDWSWDAFAAQALPVLWAEAPEDLRIRSAVGRLALSLSYATIRRLFVACAQSRIVLGDDFGRLQHLAVRNAVYRRGSEVARSRSGVASPDRTAILELVDQFIAGSLDPTPPAWAPLAVPPAGSFQTWGEIDVGYLHATYGWMPPLAEAHDAAERASWISHWEQSVTEVVERVRRNIELRGGDFDDLPGEDYQELLRALPIRIIEMSADEARPIWSALLDLGEPAHHWIESFLTRWLIAGLQTVPATDGFVSKWDEMLDHLELSPAWTSVPETWGTQKLKRQALGLEPLMRDFWVADHAHIVSRFAERYERWCRPRLGIRDVAADFAQFLRRPAATPLLSSGLIWLADADTPAASYHRDDRYEDAVGRLLDHVARERTDIPASGTNAGDAYRTLLKRLADRQSPIALELIRRMSESN